MKIQVFVLIGALTLAAGCRPPVPEHSVDDVTHETVEQETSDDIIDSTIDTVQDNMTMNTGMKSIEITGAPVLNVYVENSGSMDAYVSGGSDLRNVVHTYVSNVGMSAVQCRETNMYFINSKIIPQGSDINKFVNNITPQKFRTAGGKRGASDMADIFQRIVPSTNDTISILVSDCIVSPGSADASEYLGQQKGNIETTFFNYAKQPNMSVLVYRFEGNFNGNYYDKTNKASKYTGKRPFYLWVIGSDKYLQEFRHFESRLNAKIQNKCIFTHHQDAINYAIILNKRYKPSKKDPKHSIEKAKLAVMPTSNGKKVLTIPINVDYSKLLVNEAYLMDVKNYQTDNDNYKVISVKKSNSSDYTHTVTVQATSNAATTVTISLLNRLAGWVYHFNEEDGTAIAGTENEDKTYALKYVMGGVHDAFTRETDKLCEFSININK